MADIPRGLNVAKALIDVDTSSDALRNLGFRIEDLDLIRGASDTISKIDLHLLSGLKDDQNRMFVSLSDSSQRAVVVSDAFQTVSTPQDYNYAINNKLISGAIKYGYVDFDEPNVVELFKGTAGITGFTIIPPSNFTALISAAGILNLNNIAETIEVGDKIRISNVAGQTSALTVGDYTVISVSSSNLTIGYTPGTSNSSTDITNSVFSLVKYWDVRQADISTSRVSSWSPVGQEPQQPDDYITYGAKISCTGEYLALQTLGLTQEPLVSEFPAEQPTHNVRLNINGEFKTFPAMKGIPIKFRTNAKTFIVKVGVVNPPLTYTTAGGSDAEIPVAFKKYDVNAQAFTNQTLQPAFSNDSASPTGQSALYGLSDLVQKPMELHVFYPPGRVKYISINDMAMEDWPYVVMSSLDKLLIKNNSLKVVPEFKKLAPNLTHLKNQSNPLNQGYDYLDELGLEDNPVFANLTSNVTQQQASLMSQTQIDRMPSSVDTLQMRNTFVGPVEVNFDAFDDIQIFEYGATSSNTAVHPRITFTGKTPEMPDASYRARFASSDVTAGTAGNSFTDHSIALASHKFVDGDLVQYVARVDDNNDLGVAPSGLTSSSISLGVNQIYKIKSVDANTVKLSNTGDTLPTTTVQIAGQGSGDFHELVKWDAQGNANIDPVNNPQNGNIDVQLSYNSNAGGQTGFATKGVKDYTVSWSSHQRLALSVCNSPRLRKLSLDGLNIKGNGTYVNVDNTNADTISESIAQQSFNLIGKALQSYNTNNGVYAIPDFSGNSSLTSIRIVNHDIPSALASDSPLRDMSASKFVGLTALTSLELVNIGAVDGSSISPTGDISNLFKDKASLISVEIDNVNGLDLVLDDNTFKDTGPNSPSQLEKFELILRGHGSGQSFDLDAKVPNAYGSNKLHDFFAVDNIPRSNGNGRTGLCFDPIQFSNTLKTLKFHTNPIVGGRLFNDDDPANVIQVPLSSLSSLTTLDISEGHHYGKIPTFSGLTNAEYIAFKNTNIAVPIMSAKDKNIYRVQGASWPNTEYAQPTFNLADTLNTGTGYLPIFPFEFHDMGYDPSETNADVVPWGSTASRGYVPSEGDYIEYSDLTVNQMVNSNLYQIRDLGSMSQSEWETAGWVANQTSGYFGRSGSSPAVGDTFTAKTKNTCYSDQVVSGTQYRIRRSGLPSGSFFGVSVQGISGSATNPSTGNAWAEGDVFTATSTGSGGAIPGFFHGAIGIILSVLDSSEPAYINYGNGKVARFAWNFNPEKNVVMEIIESIGYTGTIQNLNNLNSLTSLYLQNNSLSGTLPTADTDNLQNLDASFNRLTGAVPNMTAAGSSLVTLYLNNNLLDTYNESSLNQNTSLSKVYLQNNRLTFQALGNLLRDLITMAASGNSAEVKLEGNGATGVSIQAMNNDPNKENDGSHLKMFTQLTTSDGFSITIDQN